MVALHAVVEQALGNKSDHAYGRRLSPVLSLLPLDGFQYDSRDNVNSVVADVLGPRLLLHYGQLEEQKEDKGAYGHGRPWLRKHHARIIHP